MSISRNLHRRLKDRGSFTRDQRALLDALDFHESLAASENAFHTRTFSSLAKRGVIELRRVEGFNNLRWVRYGCGA